MGKNVTAYLVLGLILSTFLMGCRSEYERVRTSGEPAVILKNAQKYYEEEEYQKAQSLFELVIATYRGRKEAEDISFKYAYTYYYLKNYILASYYFKNFKQTYASSPKREEAEFMSAYSNYLLSPKFRLDQSYTNIAIDELQLFTNTFPNSPRVSQCNDLIDELRAKLETKAFEEGMLYFNLRSYTASIRVFENLLKDFPETKNTENVRYMIIQSAFLLAENSVLQRQPERYREALELSNEYIQRFSEGENIKKVKEINSTSQKKLNQLKDVRYQNESAGS